MSPKTLTFDGRMGASGDMLLAALVDAGADPAVLEPVESALALEYRIGRTTKCGIDATTVEVMLRETDPSSEGHGTDAGQGHHHDHEQKHDHAHGHDHQEDSASHNQADDHTDQDHAGHDHTHGEDHHNGDHQHDDEHTETPAKTEAHVHAEGHGPHRSYLEVCTIVENMALEPVVEADALAIFELLAKAEATIHGTDLEEIHFHEVGADDAIADVVGVALLVQDLDIEHVVTTPISAGGGTVSMSHGEYPIPAPAVLEIATRADWQLTGGPVDVELLTPTGAAILGYYADGVEHLPAMTVDTTGYGAGGYALDPHPNVLRATVGTVAGGLQREDIAVLETNLDDATPEVLGGLQDTLTAAGARDVSILPVTMKKSRPGHLVKVICRPADRQRVARKLAAETGTLGVRDAGVTHRWIAERRFDTVTLEVEDATYEVTVKIASDDKGAVYDVSAEYDDVAAVARESGRPIRSIADRAEETWLAQGDG